MKGVKGILLMAGAGLRFEDPIPKQFHLLHGKKIYLWTLQVFLDSYLFEEIILATSQEKCEEVKQEVGANARVIPGGKTRQESSHLALKACGQGTEIVVIHDSVRPFVTEKILKQNIAGAQKFGAVDTCIPMTDTLVHAPDHKKIHTIPSRSEYYQGQTPQSFSYPLILEAHEKTKIRGATDDCQLVLDQGKAVHLVEGAKENFKITSQFDLKSASTINTRSL